MEPETEVVDSGSDPEVGKREALAILELVRADIESGRMDCLIVVMSGPNPEPGVRSVAGHTSGPNKEMLGLLQQLTPFSFHIAGKLGGNILEPIVEHPPNEPSIN